MQTFYSNPDWTFIINFISIFLAILSLLPSIKFSFEKEIGLITWETKLVEEKLKTDSDVSLNKYKLSIAFQNFGKTVIYKSDLLNNIRIQFLKPVTITNVLVESTCKYNTIIHEIQNDSVQFSFSFLEGKKYVRLYIEYSSKEALDAKVFAKIIGGNQINTEVNKDSTWENAYRIGDKDAKAKIFVFPFLSLVLTSLSFQTFARMFNINLDTLFSLVKRFNKESYFLMFWFLLIAFLCITISRQITKAFIPFASHMKKEKEWYAKT